MESALAVFEGKKIRRIWHKEEWRVQIVHTLPIPTLGGIRN